MKKVEPKNLIESIDYKLVLDTKVIWPKDTEITMEFIGRGLDKYGRKRPYLFKDLAGRIYSLYPVDFTAYKI